MLLSYTAVRECSCYSSLDGHLIPAHQSFSFTLFVVSTRHSVAFWCPCTTGPNLTAAICQCSCDAAAADARCCSRCSSRSMIILIIAPLASLAYPQSLAALPFQLLNSHRYNITAVDQSSSSYALLPSSPSNPARLSVHLSPQHHIICSGSSRRCYCWFLVVSD